MSRESDEECGYTTPNVVDRLRQAMKNIEDEIEVDGVGDHVKCIPWPDIGTKEWFLRYAESIAEHSKNRMPDDKAHEIHQALKKFDPKFAELCKKAHDSAIEFMNYAASRVEKSGGMP